MRTARNMPIPSLARSYPDRTSLDARYRLLPLPVTEAAADSANFVCEFTGGASANETGVGGGLSGADLVFIQRNGVPGVSAGYRQLTKGGNMAFEVTLGLVNAFAQNAAGFSALWRLKDLDIGNISTNTGIFLAWLQSSPNAAAGMALLFQVYSSNRRSLNIPVVAYNAVGAMGMTLNNADVSSSNPATTECMVLASLDYVSKTAFVGFSIGTAQPANFAGFYYQALNRGDVAFAGAAAATGFLNSRAAVVGSNDASYPNGTVGVKVASITFAKYPCVVPA